MPRGPLLPDPAAEAGPERSNGAILHTVVRRQAGYLRAFLDAARESATLAPPDRWHKLEEETRTMDPANIAYGRQLFEDALELTCLAEERPDDVESNLNASYAWFRLRKWARRNEDALDEHRARGRELAGTKQ